MRAKMPARTARAHITVEVGDILELRAGKLCDVVMANLFSEVLISAAAPDRPAPPRAGGWLIFFRAC